MRDQAHLVPVVLSDGLHTLPKSGTLAVHLNGLITRINASDIHSDIKLTDTSYLTNTVAASPWPRRCDKISMLPASSFLPAIPPLIWISVGFSTVKEKCFFVLRSILDMVAKQKIERFGTVLEMDLDAFAAELNRGVLGYRRYPGSPHRH